MKVLVAGWFSFERMGATAGDLLARDVVCGWLAAAGRRYDVALAAPFVGGVTWTTVDPGDYSELVFVCGPLGNGWPIPDLLARFSGCRLIGVNLSMLDPLEAWNPFDLLLERDSSASVRPDITLLSSSQPVPVVGLVLVHPQKEYSDGRHDEAYAAIRRLLDARSMAVVPIDTRLDVNSTGLRNEREVESLIARMDVIVTSRLHGLVLAIKHGVPVVAVDPVGDGAKLARQGQVLGWPAVLVTGRFDDAALAASFDWALTEEAKATARACRDRAITDLKETRERFVSALTAATDRDAIGIG